MSVADDAVIKAAKSLIDNRDFTMVMEYMENDLLLKLTQGSPENADVNLRNFNAVQALKHGTKILANAPTEEQKQKEYK